MGNLEKLKLAVGQPELVEGSPSAIEITKDRMIEYAVEAGADLLMLPGSLSDASAVQIIALNDTRIDVAGSVVIVEAAGESYQIGLGERVQGCDFAVFADVAPWAVKQPERPAWPGVTLRPVGMRNSGQKVLAHDGGTAVYGNDGKPVAMLRDDFEEDFALVSFVAEPKLAEPCEEKLLAALVKTIRRFDENVLGGQMKWVIGLSGGLDSSVVASLLTLALGPDRVLGYSLSTKYNSDATKANAAQLADALGIRLESGSISELVDATRSCASDFGYGKPKFSRPVQENVQARLRGHLLSTFAAIEGGVVANNGNRVECALGYATMYGDAIGALAPIADLTKVKLFDLARAINGQPGCEIIPENLLPRVTDDGLEWDVVPSAELSKGQVDPMKWFYHDWLLEELLDGPSVDAGACGVLGRYLDDKLASTEAGRWVTHYGLDDPQAFIDDFTWVMDSMRRSTFKRIQAPPAITVASQASIAAPPEQQGVIEPSERFKELRARILSKR